jgi:hypothetical protein
MLGDGQSLKEMVMPNFRILSDRELLIFAQEDARYNQEPLFTELVSRVANRVALHEDDSRSYKPIPYRGPSLVR